MKTAGPRAFEERDGRRARQYSYEREHVRLDPVLDAMVRANQEAASFFDAQPPSYRRIVSFWAMSAKREETRARRLARLIEVSALGARIYFLGPNRK